MEGKRYSSNKKGRNYIYMSFFGGGGSHREDPLPSFSSYLVLLWLAVSKHVLECLNSSCSPVIDNVLFHNSRQKRNLTRSPLS